MLETRNTSVPVQLAQSGPIIESSALVSALRDDFREQDYVRLPKLIEPNLLKLIGLWIERGEFRPETHAGVGHEVVLGEPRAINLINFLVNNHEFFQIVQKITECRRIGSFISRVYRMIPNSGHYDSWHQDLLATRLVAMSINLGTEPYSGGVLMLRDHCTEKVLHEIQNTGCGDAILFRLAPDLEHRVTDVTGVGSKTAYAGWFCSEPDFQYDFGKQTKSNNGKPTVDQGTLVTVESGFETSSVNVCVDSSSRLL